MPRLDHQTLLALSIVDSARSLAAARGRMPRTCALRLALACLFARSSGDRAPFDAFWHAYAHDYARFRRPIDSNAERNADLSQSWAAILDTLGLAPSPDLAVQLRKLESWQNDENDTVLTDAIHENRRAREYFRDAREGHSPSAQHEPRLIAGKR